MVYDTGRTNPVPTNTTRPAGEFGCIGERTCNSCGAVVGDSICMCVGIFTCPRCGTENNQGLTGLRSSVSGMSENIDMWEYWKEKRGSPSEALEADYPNLLKSSPPLQMAIAQIKMAQDYIDKHMREEGKANDRTITRTNHLPRTPFGDR